MQLRKRFLFLGRPIPSGEQPTSSLHSARLLPTTLPQINRLQTRLWRWWSKPSIQRGAGLTFDPRRGLTTQHLINILRILIILIVNNRRIPLSQPIPPLTILIIVLKPPDTAPVRSCCRR
ncbi:hypothetical protein KC340_g143 [Hortaea werneckii]|nr:hypothetical protein KC340_g143 [Hortaea werneckii]